MKILAFLLIVILLSACPKTATGTDVSSKVIDRLGRPVTNAAVNIYWLKSVTKGDVREVSLVKLISDRNGIVKGSYEEKSIPVGEDIWVKLFKDGYSGYTSTGLAPEFVLEREFGDSHVRRIAALKGQAQISELRELLAGRFDDSDHDLNELIFVEEHLFRPALRALVTDPKIGMEAGQILAFIGVPEDVRLVVDNAPPPKKELFKDRWAYHVVSALLEPTTEKEWAFLRGCAMDAYEDAWVDAGAIVALKLIASPRSQQLLRDVGKINVDRADSIKSAIQYIESAPPRLTDEDIIAAGKKVAQAIKIGKWQGNKKPQFNAKEDKALVKCEFIAGRDLLVHTATFHKVDGKWNLRGVRETLQAMLALPLKSAGASEEKP